MCPALPCFHDAGVTLAREHCPSYSEDAHEQSTKLANPARPAMNRTFEIVSGVLGGAFLMAFIGWVCFRTFKNSEDPPKLILKWIFSVAVVGFMFKVAVPEFEKGGHDAIHGLSWTLICGLAMAITWRHSLIEIIVKPFASLYDGGNEEPELKPYYSIAISKRKQGKFLEAVVEIRRQLARFPNDMEGVMLLAGIQAEDLKDLPGAEITLNHFCDQPDAPPKQVAAALTQLADWQLKLAQDADSARAALEKIVMRFPDTELALLAAQRIAHLDGTEKVLLAAHNRQPMAMPESVKNIGLLESSEHLRPAEIDPAKLAADYVKHLEQHPLDTEVREKLAILYADNYQRLDLATGELEQLIEEPNQPPKRVAHWLNLLADLQIRHGADYDTARGTLEKIVERFPDLAVAAMAQTRLGRLKVELKGHKETPDVKLGVYEQNIGLKYGSPRRL
jgi:tetratricopeptide (TPR) repeat protein